MFNVNFPFNYVKQFKLFQVIIVLNHLLTGCNRIWEQFPKVVEIKMERFFLERTHSIFLI